MNLERLRVYGYAVLINKFEAEFREFLSNDVLALKYGHLWQQGVPKGIVQMARDLAEVNRFEDPMDLLDYVGFPHLKEIAAYRNNYTSCDSFLGELSKSEFTRVMDELAKLRNKIAHVRRAFSLLDFDRLLELVGVLCQGYAAAEVRDYVRLERYCEFEDIPPGFVVEEQDFSITSNLPPEEYHLEGGFVGRKEDKKRLEEVLFSDLDRVITLTGSGGVGKTALALNVAYSICDAKDCPFTAIVWFSAKTSRLTPKGISEQAPEIQNFEEFVRRVVSILIPSASDIIASDVPLEKLVQHLTDYLSENPTLLIIDNLETIMEDHDLVKFLKDVPRPSKALITSRRGLGEVERRIFLDALSEADAIRLFRLICRDKGLKAYRELPNKQIADLVERVQRYPLAIKWSLGKAALGKDVNEAFELPLKGTSDIAKFCFEDIFGMLSTEARHCLYGISMFDEPPSGTLLRYLMDLDDDVFEDAIQELTLASFVFYDSLESGDGGVTTGYGILSLTQDYVQEKLNQEEEVRVKLTDRFYRLRQMVEQEEKVRSLRSYSVYSLGAKTPEDRVAVNMVKTAKSLASDRKYSEASELFEKALEVAPTLTYVITEYAKYEASRRRFREAERLLERALDVEPTNFHIWYQGGILKKRQHKLQEAKGMLERGLELNPDHPNLSIELGRVLTFLEGFENADTLFRQTLQKTSLITGRQKAILLSHLADNYRRWGQAEKRRGNQDEAIRLLKMGLEQIDKALKLLPDRRTGDSWRRVHQDYGILLCQCGKIDEGVAQLEAALQSIKIGDREMPLDREFEAGTYFYIAAYEMKSNKPRLDRVRAFVQKGLSIVPQKSKYKKKLQNLSATAREEKDRTIGRIRFFNSRRGYGIIDTSDETCIFYPSSFRDSIQSIAPSSLKGTHVSFVGEPTREFRGKCLASDIVMVS